MKTIPYVSKKFKDCVHIFDPIFRQNYYVFYNEKKELYYKFLKENKAEYEEDQFINGQFKHIVVDNTEIGVLWAVDTSALTHEALHAVNWCLWGRGIDHNDETEEIFAYMQNFIIDRTLEEYSK